MEPRISIITLGVKDLERSKDFYHNGLGFPLSSFLGEGVAFLKTKGTILSLFPESELAKDIGAANVGRGKGEFSGITLAHNVREKDQVDEVLKLAQKAGGKIVKQAQDVFWGGYSGYFSDPDGHLWEVAWGAFPFNEDGSLKVD